MLTQLRKGVKLETLAEGSFAAKPKAKSDAGRSGAGVEEAKQSADGDVDMEKGGTGAGGGGDQGDSKGTQQSKGVREKDAWWMGYLQPQAKSLGLDSPLLAYTAQGVRDYAYSSTFYQYSLLNTAQCLRDNTFRVSESVFDEA